jgi:hypothetical protein
MENKSSVHDTNADLGYNRLGVPGHQHEMDHTQIHMVGTFLHRAWLALLHAGAQFCMHRPLRSWKLPHTNAAPEKLHSLAYGALKMAFCTSLMM